MAPESIRFNEGGLSKKNGGGQTTPEDVYSAIRAAGHEPCVMAENHKVHRDMQENDKGKIIGGQYFVLVSALIISLTSSR